NFVVPMSAPTSGTADLQVVQASTGRIYASGSVNMSTISPAIFFGTDYGNGNRQAAVTHIPDGSVNTSTNCVKPGNYITIYGTGQGFIANAPADGAPPQGLIRTPVDP